MNLLGVLSGSLAVVVAVETVVPAAAAAFAGMLGPLEVDSASIRASTCCIVALRITLRQEAAVAGGVALLAGRVRKAVDATVVTLSAEPPDVPAAVDIPFSSAPK